jgi:signal peptidase
VTMDPLAGTKHDLTADVLRSHGQCRLQVSGSSMLPTLWPGDMVLIEKRPVSQLSVGDIVMYERHGRFILHRLIGLPENLPEAFSSSSSSSRAFLVTRGDFMPHDDLPVPADRVLGVLAGVRQGMWRGVQRDVQGTKGWVAIPQRVSKRSRWVAAVLRRSSLLLRLLLRVRAWWEFVDPTQALLEAPTA